MENLKNQEILSVPGDNPDGMNSAGQTGGGVFQPQMPVTPPGSSYVPGPAGGPGAPPLANPPVLKVKEPFHVSVWDGWMALWMAFIGYLYIDTWLTTQFVAGWGITVFTAFFIGGVMLYRHWLKIPIPKASWFWFTVVGLAGISFSLFREDSMAGYRLLLLHGSVLVWCASLFGTMIAGKISNYSVMDGINSLLIIPFRNFGVFFAGITGLALKESSGEESEKKKAGYKNLLYVGIGVALCVPVLAIILPLLVSADDGNFSKALEGFAQTLSKIFSFDLREIIYKLIFAFPVTLFLYGLIAGSAHKRYTSTINKQKADKLADVVRIIPNISTYVVLIVMIFFYALFIGFQIPYFVSAFQGIRPQGYEVYSEYARKGFFELCTIATLNLFAIVCCNTFTTKQKENAPKSKWLISLNAAIGVVTLFLILTALSKMLLYISAYGLTPKRVVTSVFMVFLFIVFIGVIVYQFKKFPIVRFSVVFGTVLLCFLSFSDLDSIIFKYNMTAYLNRNLSSFKIREIWDSGYGGIEHVLANIDSFNQEDQDYIRKTLGNKYLYLKRNVQGTPSATLYTLQILNNKEIQELAEDNQRQNSD